MFNNPFLKKDPLVEAVQQAQLDGDLRRQAEAIVNEEFGVYSRNAVVREDLAGYDISVEAVYQELKEAKKLADKDYDKDGKVESPKDEVWGSRLRAARLAGKLKEGAVDAGSYEGAKSFTKSAPKEDPSTPKVPYSQLPKTGNRAGAVIDSAKGGLKEAKGTAAVQHLKHRDFKETRHPNPGAVTKAPVPGVSIAEEDLDEAMKIVSGGHEKVHVVHKGKVVKTFKDPRDARMFVAQSGAKKTVKEDEQLDEASTKAQKQAMMRVLAQHPDRDLYSRITKQGAKERAEKKSFASAKKEIKTVKENEQLDEISKELAGKYIKKAHYSGGMTDFKHGKIYGQELAKKRKTSESPWKKELSKASQKRERGIETAVNKLTGKAKVAANEETQLDELKQATIRSYIEKAHERATAAKGAGFKKDFTEKKGKKAAGARAEFSKRVKGMTHAGKRLSEEDLSEKAPPGAKYERMVKHIKAGYGKDGLTKKEKGIANATAWKAKKHSMNEAMSDDARELKTYADNHSQLYRSSHQPIVKNLQRKHDKGTYDHGKAEKLWGYHAKRAADAYHKEFGHKFSVAHRKEAAKHMADDAQHEHGFGAKKVDEASAFGKEYAAHRSLGQGATYRSKVTGQTIKIQDKAPAAKASTSPADNPGLRSSSMKPAAPAPTTWADPGKKDYSASNKGADKPTTTSSSPAPMMTSPSAGKTPSTGVSAMPGSSAPSSVAAPAKPVDPGAVENMKRRTGSLNESVTVGDFTYRIV